MSTNPNIVPLGPGAGLSRAPQVRREGGNAGAGFADALQQAVAVGKVDASQLKFSAHAKQRLETRGIVLDEAMMGRILKGVEALSEKGSREGLVVVEESRFLVSVTNRTVITAMNSKDRDVYTNIDGVVFA